ncbi:hypothetical protein FQZ97_688450 [compost metagenome]
MASSTSIDSSSPAFLPRICTLSVSLLKRAPLQASHGTFTSGRKFISMVRMPWPSQIGQRPSPVLNEKRAAVQPRMRASRVSANCLRTSSQKPT